MTSIDRTAYPRLRRSPTTRELAEAFTPSFDELIWAGEQQVRSQEHMLALVVLFKVVQRLGYFPEVEQIPDAVTAHVRRALGLPETTAPRYASERTLRHHKGLIRTRLGMDTGQERCAMLDLLVVAPGARTSAFDELKQPAPKPTLTAPSSRT